MPFDNPGLLKPLLACKPALLDVFRDRAKGKQLVFIEEHWERLWREHNTTRISMLEEEAFFCEIIDAMKDLKDEEDIDEVEERLKLKKDERIKELDRCLDEIGLTVLYKRDHYLKSKKKRSLVNGICRDACLDQLVEFVGCSTFEEEIPEPDTPIQPSSPPRECVDDEQREVDPFLRPYKSEPDPYDYESGRVIGEAAEGLVRFATSARADKGLGAAPSATKVSTANQTHPDADTVSPTNDDLESRHEVDAESDEHLASRRSLEGQGWTRERKRLVDDVNGERDTPGAPDGLPLSPPSVKRRRSR